MDEKDLHRGLHRKIATVKGAKAPPWTAAEAQRRRGEAERYFNQLFGLLEEKVYKAAYYAVGHDDEEAREIAVRAWGAYWMRCGNEKRRITNVEFYLKRIVAHEVINRYRKASRQPAVSIYEWEFTLPALPERSDPERVLLDEEQAKTDQKLSERLREILETLPQGKREALEMYLDGIEYAEMAEKAGAVRKGPRTGEKPTEATMRKRVSEAIQKVRRLWETEDQGEMKCDRRLTK